MLYNDVNDLHYIFILTFEFFLKIKAFQFYQENTRRSHNIAILTKFDLIIS